MRRRYRQRGRATASIRTDGLPMWLRDPVLRVLNDLQDGAPAAGTLEVRFEPAEGTGRLAMVFVSLSSGGQTVDGFGVGIDGSSRGEDLLVELADRIQTHFADPAAPSTPRPRCPGHNHPMVARLVAGEAWWTCPATGQRVRRIGADGPVPR